MAIIDQTVQDGYNDVRNDSTLTNWFIFFKKRVLFGYEDDKFDRVLLLNKGNGGLEEFKKELKEDQASFGYLRIVIGNDTLVNIIIIKTRMVLMLWRYFPRMW